MRRWPFVYHALVPLTALALIHAEEEITLYPDAEEQKTLRAMTRTFVQEMQENVLSTQEQDEDSQAEDELIAVQVPEEKVALAHLKGISIVSSPAETPPRSKGVHNYDVQVPGGQKKLDALLRPYLDQEISKELIDGIKQEITGYYRQKGDFFSHISIPPQEVSDGIVVVVVEKGKVGDVKWSGQRYFNSEALAKYFMLQSGEEISQEALLNDVTWLNRNPFHNTEAVLQPGVEPGTTHIELRTKDRSPWRIYGGADNTGTQYTGNARLYAGLNWGNAFWRGDILTYQYTCDPSVKKFQAHFGQYVGFLPWRHIFTAFGGYAKTNPDVGPNFISTGTSGQASIRYTIPFLPMYMPLKQEFNIGADWKYTNGNLLFVGFPVPLTTSIVNVLECMMSYSLMGDYKHHEVTFSLEAHGSPGTPLPHQSNAAYNALRTGAKAKYFYAELTLADEYSFKNRMILSSLLRMQWASAPLLPMQQFSLGGYNTVRGYAEHEFLGDDALCANFELRLPPIAMFRKRNQELIFLGFLDYGLGHNITKLGTLQSTEWLLGSGLGLRYRIASYVALRADYGFRLHQLPETTHTLGKFHLGAQLSY